MSRVVVIEFVSLDGVMHDPDGSEGSRQGGWAFRYGPEAVAGDKFGLGEVLDTGVMLLGRRTWQLFAKIWPGRDDEFSAKMNAMPKLVVSRSLEQATCSERRPSPSGCAARPPCPPSSGCRRALVGDAGHHKDPVVARGIADAFRDADLVASAVADGWHGDLEAALAEYGRQRDQCAIPLSDANLGIARLDMAAGALGAAWFQISALEQALDDPAAVRDKPTVGVAQPDTQTGAHPPWPTSGAAVGHDVADRVPDQGAEFGAGDVVERVPGHEQPPEHRAQ